MYISLDTNSGTPLYLQLKEQVRLAIATATLRPGDQLPTVRDLASQLRINPNTVARVYRELCAEGLMSSRQGSGTFVADEALALADGQSLELVPPRLRPASAAGRTGGAAAWEGKYIGNSVQRRTAAWGPLFLVLLLRHLVKGEHAAIVKRQVAWRVRKQKVCADLGCCSDVNPAGSPRGKGVEKTT